MITRRWWLAGIAGLVVALLMLGVIAWPGGQPRAANSNKPNIVFVLTDDLDWSLVRFMPHVLALERAGTTFDHYFVADSLCCPSRATIFTGLFPHDTGVKTNYAPRGGYFAFTRHHDEKRTFAVAAQRGGYLTSMMGKYLNEYGDRRKKNGEYVKQYMTQHVPAGWSDWHVSNIDGYGEFNYPLNENRHVVRYTGPPSTSNYMTDVLTQRATAFIDRAAAAQKPFQMEVATFAPHTNNQLVAVPAPQNKNDFPGLRQPRDPSFNTNNVHPPKWMRGHPQRIDSAWVRAFDRKYRRRAQAVEAVDQLLATVEAELSARGLASNTYIVFASDNGYHIGQHRLFPGKETAFDTDIKVPLIVAGPGVPHRTVSSVVQNTDLYPTFLEMAGLRPSSRVDGHSLLGLLHPARGTPQPKWRTVALLEHTTARTIKPRKGRARTAAGALRDPDLEYQGSVQNACTAPLDLGGGGCGGGTPGQGPFRTYNTSEPPTYSGIRLFNRQFGNAVYVEYADGSREYYNIARDPFERHNIYRRLSASRRKRLHRILIALKHCHSANRCWKAAQPR